MIQTKIEVPGLKREVRILHITDAHLCQADPGSANEARCRKRVADWERMEGADYALATAGVLKMASDPKWDAVVLSGDIIDFPSRASIELTADLLRGCTKPFMFISGNHDWNFPGDAPCAALRETNLPLLKPLFGARGPGLVDRIEVGGLQILGIDNSTYQILPEQLSFTREHLQTGQTTILMMHVPMDQPELRVKTVQKWAQPISMGSEIEEEVRRQWGIDPPRPETAEFIKLMKQARNLRAILAGHVHFGHTERWSESAVQIVTAPGFSGQCGEVVFTPVRRE